MRERERREEETSSSFKAEELDLSSSDTATASNMSKEGEDRKTRALYLDSGREGEDLNPGLGDKHNRLRPVSPFNWSRICVSDIELF